jgi:hypothetical protein
MRAARRACMLALAVALSLAARTARAETAAEATARRVLIILRVLAYDKALATRAPGDELAILLVSAPTEEARRDREGWRAGFAMLPKVRAGGRPIKLYTIDYSGDRQFDSAVALIRPAAVIVGSGLAGDVAGIRRVTRARQASSFSTREADVRDGVAIGIVMGEERIGIVINLEAARAEGARFGAGLLQLASLVDERRP